VTVSDAQGTAVVSLVGEFDRRDVVHLNRVIARVVENDAQAITLDLTAARILDAGYARAVVAWWRSLADSVAFTCLLADDDEQAPAIFRAVDGADMPTHTAPPSHGDGLAARYSWRSAGSSEPGARRPAAGCAKPGRRG
jgi:hypothetical protein